MLLRRVRIVAKVPIILIISVRLSAAPLDGYTSHMILVTSLKYVQNLHFRLKSGENIGNFIRRRMYVL